MSTQHVLSEPGNLAKYATAKKLAELLGVSAKTVHRWAAAGLIGRYKLSRKTVLFDIAEANATVQSHRVGAESK